MTYRDPNDAPYRDPDPLPRQAPGTNPPRYPADRDRWGAGSILGIIVVLVLIVGAIAYAMNRGSPTTASGPSATQSTPTTGQGGSAAPGAGR
jgi:hypothetical protein